jgi:hypothetical protein
MTPDITVPEGFQMVDAADFFVTSFGGQKDNGQEEDIEVFHNQQVD